MSLGLTTAASAIDAAVQKKIDGSSMTTLIISNEEIKYIMEIAKYLEESDLLNKCVRQAIENKAQEQRKGFLGPLITTLGVSLLGIMLAGKEVI